MQRVEIAISGAGDSSRAQAATDLLPPEILGRIFELSRAESCNLYYLGGAVSSSAEQHYHEYPDNLAQVCVLWRQVALSLPFLWRHIDLSAYKPCYEGLLARAESYVERAGEIPIELHLAEGAIGSFSNPQLDEGSLHAFISRISSLVDILVLDSKQGFCNFQYTILSRFLLNRQSGLKKLVLRAKASVGISFFSARDFEYVKSEDEHGAPPSQDELERGFAPLTALHLESVFPQWPSAAYQGLVELRLLSKSAQWIIGEPQFITILKSSPGLKILFFGFEFRRFTTDTSEITPVTLLDLEVVCILPGVGGIHLCPGRLLRLLAPGSKPLQLSFWGYCKPSASFPTEVEAFFARTKVTRFYARDIFPPLDILRRHAYHLEQVVLDNYAPVRQCEPHTDRLLTEQDRITSLPRTTSLRITNSILFHSDLPFLVDWCPDGIELYSCRVSREEWPGFEEFSTEDLSRAFPTIKNFEHPLHRPHPAVDWDWDTLV